MNILSGEISECLQLNGVSTLKNVSRYYRSQQATMDRSGTGFYLERLSMLVAYSDLSEDDKRQWLGKGLALSS